MTNAYTQWTGRSEEKQKINRMCEGGNMSEKDSREEGKADDK